MKTKEEIRIQIKEKLKNTSKDTKIYKSNFIQKELIKLSKNFKNIFCYIETKDEVITTDFIKIMLKKGKNIFVPKIINQEIYPVNISSLNNLRKGIFNIEEPINGKIYTGTIDLSIVPGIGFTKDGKRIGRGKGFYDKFFYKNKDIFKIGICFDFQIIKEFKVEKHDILMNKVIYY